jgi:hypothetical protein
MRQPSILPPSRGVSTGRMRDRSRPRLAVALVSVVLILLCCGWPEVAWAQRRPAARPRPQRAPAAPVDEVEEAPSSPVRQTRNSVATSRDDAAEDRLAPYRNGPLAKLVAYCEESKAELDQIDDYTAIFVRKELVKRRLVQQKMEMKVRRKPFSVYFHFVSPEEAGREVIYVDGANRNQLLVHEVGLKALAGTLSLPLNDPRVVAESRHPITSVGLHNIIKVAFENFPKDAVDENVQVKKYPSAKLNDVECVAFVIRHPEPLPGLPYHETHLYFDKETKLPIHVKRFDWPRRAGDKPVLLEEYTYERLRTNVGLKNIDFDPRNPRYQFPR